MVTTEKKNTTYLHFFSEELKEELRRAEKASKNVTIKTIFGKNST